MQFNGIRAFSECILSTFHVSMALMIIYGRHKETRCKFDCIIVILVYTDISMFHSGSLISQHIKIF